MNNLPLLPPIICLLFSVVPARAGSIQIYPAPAGEELSKDFGVQVEGKQVPVYVAKVASAEPERRWKAMDDKAHSADYFEKASFAYFDMQGTVTVTVGYPEVIQSAKVLPSSRKITPTIQGKSLSLTLSEPKPLTIEVNGDWVRSLHLFANPIETDAPRPDDPNVIYFGPGIHQVSQHGRRQRQQGQVTGQNPTIHLSTRSLSRSVQGSIV